MGGPEQQSAAQTPDDYATHGIDRSTVRKLDAHMSETDAKVDNRGVDEMGSHADLLADEESTAKGEVVASNAKGKLKSAEAIRAPQIETASGAAVALSEEPPLGALATAELPAGEVQVVQRQPTDTAGLVTQSSRERADIAMDAKKAEALSSGLLGNSSVPTFVHDNISDVGHPVPVSETETRLSASGNPKPKTEMQSHAVFATSNTEQYSQSEKTFTPVDEYKTGPTMNFEPLAVVNSDEAESAKIVKLARDNDRTPVDDALTPEAQASFAQEFPEAPEKGKTITAKADDTEWLEKAIRDAGEELESDGGGDKAWKEFTRAYRQNVPEGSSGAAIQKFQTEQFQRQFGPARDLYAEAAQLKADSNVKTLAEVTRPPKSVLDKNFQNLLTGLKHEVAQALEVDPKKVNAGEITALFGIKELPSDWGKKGDSLVFDPAQKTFEFAKANGEALQTATRAVDPVVLARLNGETPNEATADITTDFGK